MDNPEDSAPADSDIAELKQRFAEIGRHNTIMFCGLVVLSLIVMSFLIVQQHRASKDLESITKVRYWTEMNIQEGKNVMDKLAAYGQTHPEYVQFLAKHGIKQGTESGPNSAAPAK